MGRGGDGGRVWTKRDKTCTKRKKETGLPRNGKETKLLENGKKGDGKETKLPQNGKKGDGTPTKRKGDETPTKREKGDETPTKREKGDGTPTWQGDNLADMKLLNEKKKLNLEDVAVSEPRNEKTNENLED